MFIIELFLLKLTNLIREQKFTTGLLNYDTPTLGTIDLLLERTQLDPCPATQPLSLRSGAAAAGSAVSAHLSPQRPRTRWHEPAGVPGAGSASVGSHAGRGRPQICPPPCSLGTIAPKGPL